MSENEPETPQADTEPEVAQEPQVPEAPPSPEEKYDPPLSDPDGAAQERNPITPPAETAG